MRFFDFLLVTLITASLAAVIVVFHNDAMPYPAGAAADDAPPASRPWAGIWIHSSGSRAGSAASIDRAHASRGGLPFHFVIGNGTETADGVVEEGHRWKTQSPGLNPDVIEICLVGDLDRERPTRKQIAALDDLLLRLCRERLIPASEIFAESEKNPGVRCPGRTFSADETRAVLRGRLAQ
ncbi:MAG: N-acetylmuramoyl-L-alanine amidase [Candidatus Brocadiae bacterium]|nr:N-acetylmuramoyl-L-alanine amidase [Candidatus Brocadiia bacterium]